MVETQPHGPNGPRTAPQFSDQKPAGSRDNIKESNWERQRDSRAENVSPHGGPQQAFTGAARANPGDAANPGNHGQPSGSRPARLRIPALLTRPPVTITCLVRALLTHGRLAITHSDHDRSRIPIRDRRHSGRPGHHHFMAFRHLMRPMRPRSRALPIGG